MQTNVNPQTWAAPRRRRPLCAESKRSSLHLRCIRLIRVLLSGFLLLLLFLLLCSLAGVLGQRRAVAEEQAASTGGACFAACASPDGAGPRQAALALWVMQEPAFDTPVTLPSHPMHTMFELACFSIMRCHCRRLLRTEDAAAGAAAMAAVANVAATAATDAVAGRHAGGHGASSWRRCGACRIGGLPSSCPLVRRDPAVCLPKRLLLFGCTPVGLLAAGCLPVRLLPAGCRQVGLLPTSCLHVGLLPAGCHQLGLLPAGCLHVVRLLPAGCLRGLRGLRGLTAGFLAACAGELVCGGASSPATRRGR